MLVLKGGNERTCEVMKKKKWRKNKCVCVDEEVKVTITVDDMSTSDSGNDESVCVSG